MKARDHERESARDELRALLHPGDTVYTLLRHRSRSGMLRRISVVILRPDGPCFPDYLVSRATGIPRGKEEGLRMGGCGMDMGFALVYELSAALYPHGHTCTGETCPSNDHTNGDREYHPHMHKDGGYALRHRWL